jgi:hypothetical protein
VLMQRIESEWSAERVQHEQSVVDFEHKYAQLNCQLQAALVCSLHFLHSCHLKLDLFIFVSVEIFQRSNSEAESQWQLGLHAKETLIATLRAEIEASTKAYSHLTVEKEKAVKEVGPSLYS